MAKRSTVPSTDALPLLFLLASCLAGVFSSTAHPGYEADGAASCGFGGAEDDDLKVVRREVYDDGRIIDITHRYVEDMPSWESSDGVGQFLWLPKSMKNGSLANNSEMKLPTHTGTHVDAPGHVFQHYFDAGFDVDTLDLGVLNGPALLVDVPRNKNLTAEVMESLNIPKGVRRVLFRTLNTERKLMFKKDFDTSYVGFMKDGAQWLVDNTDVKLVGVDYLSAAAYDDLIPSHLVFLKNRIGGAHIVQIYGGQCRSVQEYFDGSCNSRGLVDLVKHKGVLWNLSKELVFLGIKLKLYVGQIMLWKGEGYP